MQWKYLAAAAFACCVSFLSGVVVGGLESAAPISPSQPSTKPEERKADPKPLRLAPALQAGPFGAWEIAREPDPIHDSILACSQKDGKIGIHSLVIRDTDGTLEVFLSSRFGMAPLGNDYPTHARFDHDPAFEVSASTGSNGSLFIIGSSRDRLLSGMTKSKRLVLRATGEKGTKYDMEFDVSEARDLLVE